MPVRCRTPELTLKRGTDAGIVRTVAKEVELTRESLEKAALRMLSRRDATRHEVSTALSKRVAKSKDAPADAKEWIEAILNACHERGYLSDSRYAANRFAKLRRQGSSRRKIESTLQKKGITGEAIGMLFEEEAAEAETMAARRTVARRRFGRDPERFDKELASLGRAGFGYDDARRALELAEEDLAAEDEE